MFAWNPFFFFQTEKGSLPESANSKMCLWDLPLPPQGESHRCRLVLGEAGAQTQVPHQALQTAPSNTPPPGPRAPGGAPTAKPHQPHRPQDHGVGRRLAEGQRALCLSHGTWPPHWALTRVLSRGLGGPLPHVHGTMQPVAPSDMPTATRQDCLPPTRQPPALHSKTATSVWVTGPEPTHRARTSANTNSRPWRSRATPKPAAHHAARPVHGQPGTASRRLAGN